MKLPWFLLISYYGLASAFQIQTTPTSTIRPQRLHRVGAPLSAVVDTNEGTPRDVGTMEEWATACGVQRSEGFQLTSDDGGIDIYAMTSEDLSEESPVLFVPNQLIFSSNMARQELGGYIDDAEDLVKRLDLEECIPEFYLMVKILMEYQQGDQSLWFPWLNAMPRTYYNGASMTRT
eukprot:scaffold978_cov164-Amphora_coffeaeformis.AAC.11